MSKVRTRGPPIPPFENVLVCVFEADGNRLKRYEAIDVTDVDRARSRFEHLRPTRRPGDRKSGVRGGRA